MVTNMIRSVLSRVASRLLDCGVAATSKEPAVPGAVPGVMAARVRSVDIADISAL